MESQPQYSEFRNNPENFHPCLTEDDREFVAFPIAANMTPR